MPVAIPFIAAAAGAAASAVIGAGILGAVAAAGAALVVSAVGAAVFRPKSPSAVRCELDRNNCAKAIKVTNAEMATLNITTNAWHPEWNYTISPRSKTYR